MSPEGFEALHAAVRVARDRQIKTVAELREALSELGFLETHITEALEEWASYLRRNPPVT